MTPRRTFTRLGTPKPSPAPPARPERIPTTWSVLANSILTELHTGPVTRAEEYAHTLAKLIIEAGEEPLG